MADNYLERRMEDLRNGKVAREYRKSGSSVRRTGMHFVFPPKRVLIASDNPQVDNITRQFLNADCKVSVMSNCYDQSDRNAAFTGVRRYPLNPIYMDNLLKAWRDIDILIADSDIADAIIRKWREHRIRYPYVSDYVCRIILFTPTLPPTEICAEWENTLNATVNAINLNCHPENDISSLTAMLTLPANNIISRMIFQI
ncbi:MAG: hypothetical protein K2M31_08285 [Muribaculaceae bacterium]|nr:hypothetical protein [Muribaculaceae bacterium]